LAILKKEKRAKMPVFNMLANYLQAPSIATATATVIQAIELFLHR
jgi:hypothetical protein